MKLNSIWGMANLSSSYLLGFGKEYRKFTMSCGAESLTLPVTPWKYSVTTSQNNKIIDILDTGEAILFGNTKLKRLKFSCFFQNQERHIWHKYLVGDSYSPAECIDRITKWKESKKPVRIIITDSPINLVMSIMDFNYREKDGTRDIWYDISLNEYRYLNTPSANNDKEINESTGLKSRPTETQASIIEAVNNQANVVNGRYTSTNGGIPIKMTDGIQAPHGCFGTLTNQGQAAIKGISNARDALEVSKAAYGNFQNLQTLQSRNNLSHVSVSNIRSALQEKAFKL